MTNEELATAQGLTLAQYLAKADMEYDARCDARKTRIITLFKSGTATEDQWDELADIVSHYADEYAVATLREVTEF